MHTSDRSDFYKFICDFPNQIKKSSTFLKEVNIKEFKPPFENIVINGMGGSAIAGDLLKAYLYDGLKVPLLVNRNYTFPDFVGPKTFFIACSYSGNTEETLHAYQLALKKKAQILAIASGGELEKKATKSSIPFIKIPGDYPPRQALGYLFFPILFLLNEMGIIKVKTKDINETVEVTKDLRERCHPKKTQSHNLSNQIAQKLYKKIPIIYSAANIFEPVVIRWRNQFNENSKVLSFSNVFPELNHNEIMGWEAPKEILSNLNIILLRDPSESPRNKRRLEITKDIFQNNHFPIIEVFGEGKSTLARIFSMIYIGDWVSYYLALLYDKDPYKIKSINLLKETLSQYKDYEKVN